MTSEERLTRIERLIELTAEQSVATDRKIADNADQIAHNAKQIAKLEVAIAETHTFILKLERKVDQLSSVIAHLVGRDPMEFMQR